MKTCPFSTWRVASLAPTLHSTARRAATLAAPLGRLATALPLTILGASTALAQVGTNYCTPAISNSTGAPAVIAGSGSAMVLMNNFSLTGSVLPLNSFGFFLTSRDQGFVFPVHNSQGRMCLVGNIGRYVGQGQVKNSGSTGTFSLAIDLTSMPTPFGSVAVLPGETWNFQCWYRDAVGGSATSNFSDGLAVLFTGGGGNPIPGMMPIPAGSFLMGSNAPGGPPYFGEYTPDPVHQVTISYPFWMGRHEVTQGQYQALMGSNPSTYPGTSRPVETMSWYQARAYCAALTAQQAGNLPAGYEYRLPTEAEWEYACRAGTTTEFHYGPSLLCGLARFYYSFHSGSECVGWQSGTMPVGSYAPNAFGLYDMHGNLWEWCLDSWAPYISAAVTDPFVTGGPYRIFRGGSWGSNSRDCRSAFRYGGVPGFTDHSVGFRVVLAPVLVP
jgi:formylglycine-generating enzyme required for sulfatase activity